MTTQALVARGLLSVIYVHTAHTRSCSSWLHSLFHTLTPVLARSRAYLRSLVVTLAWPVLFVYVMAGHTLDVRATSIHTMSEFVRVCLCICVFVSECTFACACMVCASAYVSRV